MNFSAWAIRSPVAPILGFVILCFLGLASFFQLPISRFPVIETPVVSVTVVSAGSTPDDLDSTLAPLIEEAIEGLPGVKSLRTVLRDSLLSTTAEFRMSVNGETARQEVERALASVDWPNTAEPPRVSLVEAMGGALLTYALSGPDIGLGPLSLTAQDEVLGRILSLPGVGRVELYGAALPEIAISFSPSTLAAHGLSLAQVSAALRAATQDLPAGQTANGQAIRLTSAPKDLDSLGALLLHFGNKSLRLNEIADLRLTTETPRSFTRFEQEQSLAIAIFKGKGASETELAERVGAEMASLNAIHPELRLSLIDSMVEFSQGNFKTSMHTLYEGALLAIVVVFLFLRDWRATLIAALALPLSAIPTFWVMDLLGFSLNLISLLGLTLATGLLVDDAIVEIENIERHMQMGKDPFTAARDAADEIGLAVISTSLTIVAIFVPVSFLPGVPGQYFEQFGLTVAVAVLFSLVVARLITPLLCAYFLKPSHAQRRESRLQSLYLRLVRVTSHWRYSTLLVALAALGLSIWSIIGIPGAFMPPEDQNRLTLSLELPATATLAETEAQVRSLEAEILQVDGVRALYTLGGASPSGATSPRRAALTVLLEPVDKTFLRRLFDALGLPPRSDLRLRPDTEIENEIFERARAFADIRLTAAADLTYSILSENPDDLAQAIAALESALRAEPLFASVSTDGAMLRPQWELLPNPLQMAQFGVTSQSLAEALRLATQGDIAALQPQIRLDGTLTPIRITLAEHYREEPSALARLPIATAQGTLVPLDVLARLVPSSAPESITRLSGARLATISTTLPPDVALGTARARFEEITSTTALPESVRLAPSGDAELQEEVMSSFSTALTLGLLLMLALLILLFGSVLQPLTILLSLPFSLGGVAAALHLSGAPLSMPILIGILLLFGLVTKNAILLVDFAILMRKEGYDRIEAVVEAGKKRAQPIIMTSIAMAAGMIPSALGVGDGGAFRSPMALAVIGGILSSTLLSLVLVPALYLVMDDLSRLMRRRR